MRRVAPKPKPSGPEVAKPKPARADMSLIVKSLKKEESPIEEPLKNYVAVEDKMIAIDLKHISNDEEKDL